MAGRKNGTSTADTALASTIRVGVSSTRLPHTGMISATNKTPVSMIPSALYSGVSPTSPRNW